VSDLLATSIASLVASWERYADWSPGARVLRDDDVAVGVFPEGSERDIFNNAVVRGDARRALAAVGDAYGAAGIERYAIWVHESRADAAEVLEQAGHRVVERTMAMVARLPVTAPARLAAAPIGTGTPDVLRAINELPPQFAPRMRTDSTARILVGGEPPQAALLALDHEGDCALAWMSTRPNARRRGLASALCVRALADAAARGCTTASLQSTPDAEGVYRAVGFEAIGRFREYAPQA
jgi:ribosomal protein S18 acetylase RimI-like enzyme